MDFKEVDTDNLPKYVLAYINADKRVVDFAKTVLLGEEDVVRDGTWQIPVYDTAEEAQHVLDQQKECMVAGTRVWHLDELHVAFHKFLTENPLKSF